MSLSFDKIIIGAGIYGLYAAVFCALKGENVVVLEYDDQAASRATYINQARVHKGYHYPRSYSTAIKSALYFERFCEDYHFAIHHLFRKIYATSSVYSLTSAEQFRKFCKNANIKCQEIIPTRYFKKGVVDGAFETKEYAFDGKAIKDYYISKIDKLSNVRVIYKAIIKNVEKDEAKGVYALTLGSGEQVVSNYVLNATYASVNQIINMFGFELYKIKYEICEIALCEPNEILKDVGITVMDGPFFSVMPFGFTNMHSLTSVTFTPHITSYEALPLFECQKGVECSPAQLENCNICPNRPKTAWDYLYALARKYLNSDVKLSYKGSLFAIKPILTTSEIDDSRPTVIKQFSNNPTFISVLSGKINTIYDLDEVL